MNEKVIVYALLGGYEDDGVMSLHKTKEGAEAAQEKIKEPSPRLYRHSHIEEYELED
uniref:Uncharacterized protein n=1 Tax=viral metagenome TaxID=1070528 RepID=A0A6M3L4H6_9ZZZZ